MSPIYSSRKCLGIQRVGSASPLLAITSRSIVGLVNIVCWNMSSKPSARRLFKFGRKEEEGIGAQNNGHTPMVSQLERKAETWMTGDPSHLRNPNDGHPIEPQASEQAMPTVQYTCSALPTTSIAHNPSQNDSPRPSAPGNTGEHTNSQAPRKQRYRLSLSSLSIQFSTALEPYEYAPLPRGNYTRYLVLQPGKDKEALLCHLHTCALTDLSEVETISYVWGSSNKTKRLWCAGKTIPITVNLRDVLRRVRLPDAPRTLWADSICINQEDRKEKSEQVALMGLIFGGGQKDPNLPRPRQWTRQPCGISARRRQPDDLTVRLLGSNTATLTPRTPWPRILDGAFSAT